MRKALQAPARQIATNAGEDGSVIVGKILENSTYGFGFDAQGGEYVDMVKKGIIDPTKVVRQALQGASSVAGLLITTEAMVAELPKKKDAMPADAARRRRNGFLRKSITGELNWGAAKAAPLFFCAYRQDTGGRPAY